MVENETVLAGELWLSFRSVLRSYAAAASLHSEEAARVAWTESDITLTGTNASLELKLDLASGRGSWHLHVAGDQTAHGKFDLLPEGTIDTDGNVKDLDHAAIVFVYFVLKGHGFSRADPEGASGGTGSQNP
jgi:hypothetical protein